MFSKTVLALIPLAALAVAQPAAGSSTLATSTRAAASSAKATSGANAAGTATASGSGSPAGTQPASSGNGACMTQADAEDIVKSYIDNVAGPNFNAEIADKILAEEATLTSQTVLSLGGVTGEALQGLSAPNKSAIIDTESHKAFKLDMTLEAIEAVGCDSVAFRAKSFPVDGPGKVPIRSISIFKTVKNEQWQIKAIYGEFNSFLLDQDLGGNCKPLAPPSDSGSTSASASATGTQAAATGKTSATGKASATGASSAKASATGASSAKATATGSA